MNTSWEELLPKLRADQDYRTAFASLYGGDPAEVRAGRSGSVSKIPDDAECAF